MLDAFIREGAFERHLNRMRKVYKEKHDLLLEELRPLMKDFSISGENAGLHVLLTDKKGRSEEWLVSRAEKAGVRVYGISEAMVGNAQRTGERATILLGFGGLTKEEISLGIGLLKEAWRKLKKRDMILKEKWIDTRFFPRYKVSILSKEKEKL